MTTVNNAHRRAYTLKVGPVTYGVFLLQEADWFDDGICFCGPMVHHAYAMRDGCPVRYSLLPGGAVKKAQVLGGDGLRLMAFEWTHLGCSRAIYERLTLNGLRRMPHPVEGSLAWALKYAGADRVTAAAEAGSGADPFADWRRADGYSLLEWQARHDAGTLPRSVNRLMEAAPDAWAETVLDHAAHLRPELGTALAVRLARQARATPMTMRWPSGCWTAWPTSP